MKQLLSSLVLAFSVFSVSNSVVFAEDLNQADFDLQLFRTEVDPGFFAIKIDNYQHLKPLNLQNVFVRNYEQEALSGSDNSTKIDVTLAKKVNNFKKLEHFIGEINGLVISPDELSDFQNSPDHRIIFLGNDNTTQLPKTTPALVFNPHHEGEILDEFDAFFNEFLTKSVLIKDITISAGGNISDIYPKNILQAGGESLYFVGKFEKPQKTIFEISATSHAGQIMAITPLSLNNFAEFNVSANLPDLWETFYLSTQPKIKESKQALFSAFPLILAGLGILVILIGVFFLRKQENVTSHVNKDEDDDLLDNLFGDDDEDEDDPDVDSHSSGVSSNTTSNTQSSHFNPNTQDYLAKQTQKSTKNADDSLSDHDKETVERAFESRTREESLLMQKILSEGDIEDLQHASTQKIEDNLPFFLQKKK